MRRPLCLTLVTSSRAVWADGRSGIRIAGDHYRLAGAHPGPVPAHDVQIWIGALKPRMLVAQRAPDRRLAAQ